MHKSIEDSLTCNGYTLLHNCIPQTLLDLFESNLKTLSASLPDVETKLNNSDAALIEKYRMGGSFRPTLHQMLQTLPALHQIGEVLFNLPEITVLLNHMGFVLPGYSYNLRVDIPNEETYLLAPHQDYAGMRSRRAVRVWLPLRDVGPVIGSMQVYEGSQAEGVLPHTAGTPSNPAVEPDALSAYSPKMLALPAGTGVLFDMLLAHASVPNISDRIKFILVFTIQDLSALANPDNPDDKIGSYAHLHKVRTDARKHR
jgi:hypothetical protein